MQHKAPGSIVYSFLIADLFTYGHVRMLELAKSKGEWHVCGVITDQVARRWTAPLMGKFEERLAVIKSIKCVDEVLVQDSMDPTENLRALHERYPQAQISLVQSHHLWNSTLGTDYIREIGGTLVPNEFYQGLSRDAIKKTFFDYFNARNSEVRPGDGSFNDLLPFSTKANTLDLLRKKLTKAAIEPSMIFTVTESLRHREALLDRIQRNFSNVLVVVRSSSLQEDGTTTSNAGKYHSVLNVNPSDRQHLSQAIAEVVGSYARSEDAEGDNQVLIQKQTDQVRVSGVVFTRNLWTNTPYYLISYDDESGKTDSVTNGSAGKRLEILRDAAPANIPPEWQALVDAVKEVEQFFSGICLDIEFAIRHDGKVVIFQVRPLAANARFNTLSDGAVKSAVVAQQHEYQRQVDEREPGFEEYYLSDMAFWNPAELIGDRPAYLDTSLFEHILMKSNWNEALCSLGYSRVPHNLMTTLAGKPYIILNHAFKALLPEVLPDGLKSKLVNHYNRQIQHSPELHDKIEFCVAHNCLTFDFARRAAELADAGFCADEIRTLQHALTRQTNEILSNAPRIVRQDNAALEKLDTRNEQLAVKCAQPLSFHERLDIVATLIEDCKLLGTTQFSRLARMAFIGSSLLTSLVSAGHAQQKVVGLFLRSIRTVATELEQDLRATQRGALPREEFLRRYGHLRPGTYDITQLPYRQSPVYFDFTSSQGRTSNAGETAESLGAFTENEEQLARIFDQRAAELQLACSGAEILDFIRTAIELRERYKFIYTKNISLALEQIAQVGVEYGFTRQELALVDYYSIVNHRASCSQKEITSLWRSLIKSRQEELAIYRQVSLPPILFSKRDFTVVPFYVSKPNFITTKRSTGHVLVAPGPSDDFNGKIVVIEKADPGYDWIFAKPIAGLITKYGGANSHMAIRSAEFGLPAAIGCGTLLYSSVVQAHSVTLDCERKTITTHANQSWGEQAHI